MKTNLIHSSYDKQTGTSVVGLGSKYGICEYDYNAKALRNVYIYNPVLLWDEIPDVFPNFMQAVRFFKSNIKNFL